MNSVHALTVHVTKFHFNTLKPSDAYIGRTAPLTSRRCILYIYILNISNMLHTLRFFPPSSKCRLFRNTTLFGSCLIRILHTGCANI
jgi:hypothetical protein